MSQACISFCKACSRSTLRAINALLNSKKDASLGNQSAQDVWEAGIEVINKTQTPTDVQIIRFAAEAQRERAEKRRGPSAGATQPFTIGMVVREANMKYVKASSSLRGNKLKMGWPRAWQITLPPTTMAMFANCPRGPIAENSHCKS